ncbi:conjugal transfer protein [Thauera sp. 28]|uniref:type IV secretion system protein n=1 Tax=Thauera sp. 28 TaxID=303682 RepID=UPI0002CDD914|nr:type IV secretion system protein [Thauera sp. 28]ENO90951.1 conjugal transfer protein [Thauera sp. 28]
MAVTVLQDAFQYLDTATAQYIGDYSSRAASTLVSFGKSMLVLYVILWGWSMMRGLVQEPVTDMVWRVVKIASVFAIATMPALYSAHVSNFLYEWPSAFAGALQGGAAQNSAQLLDEMLDKGSALGSQALEKGGIRNLNSTIVGLIIYAVTFVVVAISTVVIVMAKYMLAILLAVGPLFILALLFEQTREGFQRWLGAVFTNGLTIVFTVLAATLMFKLMNSTFDVMQTAADGNGGVATMKHLVPLVIYGVICGFTILTMPQLSGTVGGALGLANAAPLGWAYNKIRNAAPGTLRMGKRAGQAGYRGLRGAAGRFGRGTEGGSVSGSRSAGQPGAVYRKITSQSRRTRAA